MRRGSPQIFGVPAKKLRDLLPFFAPKLVSAHLRHATDSIHVMTSSNYTPERQNGHSE